MTAEPATEHGPHRYLIGAATTTYRLDVDGDRRELAGSLDAVRDLFAELGYQTVAGFGLDMRKDDLVGGLRAFLTHADRRPDDVVVIYYTGHGVPARRDLLLPTYDSDGDLAFTALRASDLTGRLLEPIDGVPLVVQQLLFILDTCYASAAAADMVAGVIGFVDGLRGSAKHPSMAVMTGARPYERATSGAYTRALTDAVRHQASGGHEQEYLPLDTLTRLIGKSTPSFQHAASTQISETTAPFFPNPRFDHWLRGFDLRTQKEARIRQDRDRDLASHILPRAQGLDTKERDDLWLFQGRHQALREVCRWLQEPEPATTIVTADPGSGKSALLARLFVLADPRWRGRIPNPHLLPPGTMPEPGSITEFIHAHGHNPQDLLAAISHACQVERAETASQLIARLRATGPTPHTIIIDAIDEAIGGPGDSIRLRSPIVEQVLTPLIAAAPYCGLRLLLGTRRHLVAALGGPAAVINLDNDRYSDRPSIHAYVKACLIGLNESSLYRHEPAAYLDAVAEAIAVAAGRSFLVALITARSHALHPDLVDPRDPVWRASLPRYAADAMRDDLNRRLGDLATKARDLLLPLAYAQGSGLPWEDLWPALVTALTDRPCTNTDLDWLIEHAGYYVIEDLHGQRSVYRLYHESLAEHLRHDRDTTADHVIITRVLTDRVPRLPDGTTDWAQAHPYTHDTLATHAAAGNQLDTVISQPRLLLYTSAAALRTALHHTHTPHGRAIADSYYRADSRIRASPESQHASYLQLAARCARAPRLADAITTSGLPLPWTTNWASWRLQPFHQTLTGHTGPVNAVTIGQLDGRAIIISGSDDRTVRLWDAATGAPVGTPLLSHSGNVLSVAIGELNGRAIIASGSDDGTVRVSDAATGSMVAELFNDMVTSVAVGGLEGRAVVVTGSDEAVRIWDAATGSPVGEPFTGHAGNVLSVAIGEFHGRTIVVSGSDDGTARVWDAATGTAVGQPFTDHTDCVRSVALGHRHGQTVVVSGGDDRTVRVWDAATGTPVTEPFAGHTADITSVALGQLEGRTVIISGSSDWTVRVWDAATGSLIGDPFTGNTGNVTSVATCQLDGRTVIVSGSSDWTVRAWDTTTGTVVSEPFTGHADWVRSVAFGRLDHHTVVVSGGDDQTVRIWDAATGSPIGDPLTGHERSVISVAIGDLDGRTVIVSGSDDTTVRLWDAATGTPIGTPITGHTDPVASVAIGDLDGRTVIVSGSDDTTVRLWDAATGTPIGTPITGHTDPVASVAIGDLDGRTVIVSGSDDTTVRLWDAATGTPIGTPITGHTDPVASVAIGDLDGRTVIVSGSDDTTVRLWDAATGTPIGTPITAHADWVRSVALGRLDERAVVVSGGADRTVRMWDAVTGRLIGDPFTGHTGNVLSVAINQIEGRTAVVSGSDDALVRVWDAATGAPVAEPFTGHTDTVTSAAISQLDGRAIITSASGDRTVRLWDAATGTPVGDPITGHTDTVTSVAIGQLDGRTIIVSGSDDETVRVWDAATGTPIASPFTGHTKAVTSVAIGQLDGRVIVVSGSDDETVRLWHAGSGKPVRRPFSGHTKAVTSVAIGQLDGRAMIVSSSNDRTVRIWDPNTGKPIGRPLTGHTESVRSVAIGQLNGRTIIVSSSNDRTVRIWDAATGTPLGRPLTGHTDWVRSVAIRQLGSRTVIVSGSNDETIRVWDDHGSPLLAISLESAVNTIAITAAGQLVVGADLGITCIRY